MPLFCVVKYSVVLTDSIKLRDYLKTFYFQFGCFLYRGPFSKLQPKLFLGSFYADLCCSNPLKAQLDYCGFSYHSSRINVLIILCGHTGGVITIHSELEGRQRVADLGLGG